MWDSMVGFNRYRRRSTPCRAACRTHARRSSVNAKMLLQGGAPVLTAESVQAMTTDQLTPAQKTHSGLGPDFFTGRSWGFCQAVLESCAYGWDGGLTGAPCGVTMPPSGRLAAPMDTSA